jgi:hypothetical protein
MILAGAEFAVGALGTIFGVGAVILILRFIPGPTLLALGMAASIWASQKP